MLVMTATASSPEGLKPSGEDQAEFDFAAYLAKTRDVVEKSMGRFLSDRSRESMRSHFWPEGSDWTDPLSCRL